MHFLDKVRKGIRRHAPKQVEVLLKRARAATIAGKSVARACRDLGISQTSYYRWRAKRAGGAGRIRQIARDQLSLEVIRSAKDVFLRHGRASNLDDVAKAAKVTRQTLYNLFGSKEQLFREVVRSIYERILRPVLHVDRKEDMRETLYAYGRQLLIAGLDLESLLLLRLTVAELRDFPDLGKILYRATARQAPALAGYFDEQIDAGNLIRFDTLAAAHAFSGAITSHARWRTLLGAGVEPEERTEATLGFAVDTFVRGLKPARSDA